MSEQEILKMESGRTMDALVASELFGKTVYLRNGYWYVKNPQLRQLDTAPLPYSSDMGAAMLIIEMGGAWDIKKRFRPHPDDPLGLPGRPTYQAQVFLSDYNEYEDELMNKRLGMSPWCWSLPEAICKAALLAKLEGGGR